MSKMHYEIQQPATVPHSPVQRFYRLGGGVYAPELSDLRASQPLRRETMRVIRRHLQTEDGRSGIEVVEEHDLTYAPPAVPMSRHDPVRTGLAGVVAFLIVCVGFTMLGGGDQSPVLIPLYWGGFAALWSALA